MTLAAGQETCPIDLLVDRCARRVHALERNLGSGNRDMKRLCIELKFKHNPKLITNWQLGNQSLIGKKHIAVGLGANPSLGL